MPLRFVCVGVCILPCYIRLFTLFYIQFFPALLFSHKFYLAKIHKTTC